jgi:hypothetical protein
LRGWPASSASRCTATSGIEILMTRS